MNARKVFALCAALASGTLVGCATRPVSTAVIRGIEADAAIPSGKNWLVFRFNSLRYVRWAAARASSMEQALDSSQQWMGIASPGGAFRPVAALGGPGHFYLLDAAQGRLCLYDTAAQLLSTFPLPPAMLPFVPGRMNAFLGADGAFTFVDYQSGEAWQFADRQGGEGGVDWVLRNRVKLPLGIRDCMQEPGSADLACTLPEGPARFDASLNRRGAHHAPPVSKIEKQTRLAWDREAGTWFLEALEPSSEAKLLFRFSSARRRLHFQ